MEQCCFRCLYLAELRSEDVYQNSSEYEMFTSSLEFQYGAEKSGILTISAAVEILSVR